MLPILTIRLGALGDLVFCFQSFHEIRLAHPDAEIALLTRAPFAAFAEKMPWFDHVIVESHPGFGDIGGWGKLVNDIKQFAPTRVYDLQGKNRQTILYALLGGPWGPAWSGAAPLCKFPRLWPPTPDMSFTDFLAAQLRLADVPAASPPDLGWLDAPTEKFVLPDKYVVLIPGCSPEKPQKRWPPSHYAALANRLRARSLSCVIVGTSADAQAVAEIKSSTPQVIDLCGRTDVFELAGILRRATGIIGNDTGPLHMGAALGTPTLALFGAQSNPVWSKPPGKISAVLQCPALADLDVERALAAFDILLKHAENKG